MTTPSFSPLALLRAALVLASAAAACAIVFWNIAVVGPLGWHFTVPAYLHGGFEALLLALLLAALQALPRWHWRLAACALVAALYLRRHGVDAPALLTVFYLEFTIALGAAALRLAGAAAPRGVEDYLRCFVLGLALWSVAAWSLSALGYGSALDLRWLSLLLLPLALWARARPLSWHLLLRSRGWALPERGLFAALCAWMLVLYARTQVVYSYDGQWYGLRPEQVLNADGSVFVPLGLVSPVFYFPKLYEVFLLPLSGLGDASALSGVTILLLGLIALAAARLATRFGITDTRAQLVIGALLLGLPALANAALEPKPDILCALLLMLAWLCGGDALRQRQWPPLAWAAAAGLLALSSKLIAVPFLGMLGLGLLAAWLLQRRAESVPADAAAKRVAGAALVLSLVAAGFVMARTWLLAGMPTIGPDPLFKLWTVLGLSLREPAGTLTWTQPQDWPQVPGLVVDWLFRPQLMEHIVISWIGNVWLWLPLAALLLRNPAAAVANAPAHRVIAAFLVATGLILALGWRYYTRGSDGNYFIAALVPAIVLGFAWAWRQAAPSALARASLCGGALLIAAFQVAYAMVSAGWTPGTRVLDTDFSRSPRDTRERTRQILERNGLADIAAFLRTQSHAARVTGCVPFEPGVALPARYEDLYSISLSRPEYLRDLAALRDYMRRFGIDYLLLPRPDPDPAKPRHYEAFTICNPGEGSIEGFDLTMQSNAWRLLRLQPAAAAP
jgi:hypothetical protein